MIRSTGLVICLFVFTLPVKAQDLNETLSEVGEAYARAYVNPLADVLGAHLNTGLFHTAGASNKVFGIDVYFGVKASAAQLSTTDQFFDLVYEGIVPFDVELAGQTITLDVPATFSVTGAPTIFGTENEGFATVSVDHDTTFSSLGLTLPVSFDSTLAPQTTIGGLGNEIQPIDLVPFAVPQIGLGTIFGTDVMVRWVPKISAPDIGSLELFGFGIRHNLNQYLPVLPVDVSIQAAWQRILVEDNIDDEVLSARTFAVNVAVSKRFAFVTVYAGVQSERSDVEFSYVFEIDELDEIDADLDAEQIDVNFTLRSNSKTRGIFGLGLKLGPVLINADASVGHFTIFSAGFGFAF